MPNSSCSNICNGATIKAVKDWLYALLIVIRKNLAIRRNRWITLVMEILIPLVIISVMVRFSATKSVFRSRDLEQMNAFIAKNANRSLKESFFEYGRELTGKTMDHFTPCGKEFEEHEGKDTPCYLGYVADESTAVAVFQHHAFLNELKNNGTNVLIRFPSEEVLENCVTSPETCEIFDTLDILSTHNTDEKRRQFLADFYGAVVFETGIAAKEVKYKIRLFERYYGALGPTILTSHLNPSIFDRTDKLDSYLKTTGFLALQVLVDRLIIFNVKRITGDKFIKFESDDCGCDLKLIEMPHRGTDQLHTEMKLQVVSGYVKHEHGRQATDAVQRQLVNMEPNTTTTSPLPSSTESTTLFYDDDDDEDYSFLGDDENEDGVNAKEIDHSRVVTFSVSVTITLVLAFTFLIPSEQRRIVTEKEEGLTIMLLITGMTYRSQWIGNLIACVVVYMIPVTIMSILATHSFNLKEGALFEMAHVQVIWLLLFLYVNALSALCYMMTTFFDQAILAITFSTSTLVLSYLGPVYHFELLYDTCPFFLKLLICLHPSFALQTALKILVRFENQGVRTYLSTLTNEIPHDSMRLIYVVLMLLFDLFLYMALTIYFDRVIKSQLGVFKPWYYICQPQEWVPAKAQAQVAPNWTETATVRNSTSQAESQAKSSKVPSAATSSRRKKSQATIELTEEERLGFQAYPENAEPTIITKNLSKTYGKVNAVDDVNMTFFKGEIFVLLGHNGAGKSTLLNMFAGFAEPTSGTATICGLDIRHDMVQIQEFTGMCMQANALYEDLTALQQLLIFGRLRGLRGTDAQDESLEIMEKLHILEERNTVIRNLSEGDQRKLCLAIALIGDPRIVILDEPTGGMDYFSRRAVWNLLLKIRTSHTVIMSTNFMDEAELLGDRIGIMANGKLHVCGTASFLRRHFGLGYSLRLKMDAEKVPDQRTKDMLLSVVNKSMPNATMSHYYISPNAHRLVAFDIPLEDYSSEAMSFLFEDLTDIRVLMGIRGFFVSPALMDEVFMALAVKLDPSVQEIKQWTGEADEPGNNEVSFVHEKTKHLTLPLLRLWALIVKKMKHALRNKILTTFQIFFPTLIVVTGIARLTAPLTLDGRSGPPLEFKLGDYPNAETLIYPAERFDEKLLREVIGPSAKMATSPDISKLLITQSDLVSLRTKDIISVRIVDGNEKNPRGNISVFYTVYKIHTAPLAVNIYANILVKKMDLDRKIITTSHPLKNPYFNGPYVDEDKHAADSFAMLTTVSSTTLFAFMVVFPAQERRSDFKHLQMMTGLSSFIYWVAIFLWDAFFAFCGFTATSVFGYLYPKHRHYSENFKRDKITFASNMHGLFFVPCCCFMMYTVARLARSVGSGVSLAISLTVLCGIILPFITISLSAEGLEDHQDHESDHDHNVSTVTFRVTHQHSHYNAWLWFLRLSPVFSLVIALRKSTIATLENGKCNHFSQAGEEFYCSESFQKKSFDRCCRNCFEVAGPRMKECYDRFEILRMPWSSQPTFHPTDDDATRFGHKDTDDSDHWDWSTSKSIFSEWVSIFFVGILFFVLVIFLDSDTWRYIIACVSSLRGTAFQTDVEDDDVVDENERVERMISRNQIDEDALIAHKLGKTYGIFPAVQDINFGVHPGECFGILGVNGAGKSTLFNLLAGVITETYGNVYSVDCTLTSHRSWYMQKIGYSPHHGQALAPYLTPRENLKLFARLRDLPKEKSKQQIDEALEILNLTEHADKQIQHLSEGIKRRVSAAVSIIAKPPIILIDEPTSLADPSSRRYFWSMIQGMRREGHTVIFSSHRIAECESLCGRVAFLIDGKFQCIGSPTHLKNKFGRGYKLIIKLIQGPAADNQNYVSSLSETVVDVFNPCTVRDRRRNVVQYVIHNAQVRWDFLYKSMAVIQARFNDLVDDYEFSETTLEEVFLSFVIYQHTGRIPDTTQNCC